MSCQLFFLVVLVVLIMAGLREHPLRLRVIVEVNPKGKGWEVGGRVIFVAKKKLKIVRDLEWEMIDLLEPLFGVVGWLALFLGDGFYCPSDGGVQMFRDDDVVTFVFVFFFVFFLSFFLSLFSFFFSFLFSLFSFPFFSTSPL